MRAVQRLSAKCQISLDVTFTNASVASEAGIVLRYNTNTLHYFYCRVVIGIPSIEIVEVTTGGSVVRASLTIPLPAISQVYIMQASINGEIISFTFNGDTITYTAASENLCGEWMGLYASSIYSIFDNFEVTG